MGLFGVKWFKDNKAAGRGIFGKEGGFGSGKGKLSQMFSQAADTGPSDYTQSQIKKTDSSGYASNATTHSDYGLPIEGETGMGGPGTGEGSRINTGNIDFSNTEHVKNIQQRLVDQGKLAPTFKNSQGEEVSSVDGQFGPNTEKAYRGYVNERREGGGFDAYEYDNLLDNATSGQNNGVGESQPLKMQGPNINNPNAQQMSLQQYQNQYPGQNYQDEYGQEFGNPKWDTGGNEGRGGYMLPQGVLEQLNLNK